MSSSAPTQTRLTYDDFVLFPDDGKRHEIIDGVHYVTPSPRLIHQQLLGRLHLAIATFLEDRQEVGEVFLSPLDTIFTPWDIVEPDLMFVAGDQRSILTEKNIQGAPALVVEILSPGTRRRDQGIKRQLFDRGGVREYWLVDPQSQEVTIHRRAADGSFPRVERLGRDETLSTPLLPRFSLALNKLFK
jgi:Uma2 family endonuclease